MHDAHTLYHLTHFEKNFPSALVPNICVNCYLRNDELYVIYTVGNVNFSYWNYLPNKTEGIKSGTRGVNLFEETVLECFLTFEHGHYLELNMNFLGEWNCYEFHSYREKPLREFQFSSPQKNPFLKDLHLSDEKLQLILCLSKNTFTPYQLHQIQKVNFSAILKNHHNEKIHYALKFGDKPDFHRQDLYEQFQAK